MTSPLDKDQVAEFLRLIEALNEHSVDYIVVGGFAVYLHGLQRFTADLDVFVRPDEGNAQRLRDALRSVYPDDPVIEEMTLSEMNEYAVLRYGTPSGFYLDIMVRIGNVLSFEDLSSIAETIEGVQIRLADAASLLKMKGGSVRPQDQMDSDFLRRLLKDEGEA